MKTLLTPKLDLVVKLLFTKDAVQSQNRKMSVRTLWPPVDNQSVPSGIVKGINFLDFHHVKDHHFIEEDRHVPAT